MPTHGDQADQADQNRRPVESELKNEGEGSRTATRRYDQGAEKAAKDPEHVKKAATEAEKALEGPEGGDLRAAEERGKKNQHP